jgi:adenylylsulfate kinase
MVIWLIGLSGAGKSVIGRELWAQWRTCEPNTVRVDGDEIRDVFQHEGPEAYTLAGRKRNADRICRLCEWLDRQGLNVVCAILSIFEESRQWNREHYSSYYEVYIDVPLEKVIERSPKPWYERARRGETRDVVGFDIPFVPPAHPDCVIDNSSDGLDTRAVAARILAGARQKRGT